MIGIEPARASEVKLIREAIELHLADLRRGGADVPAPISDVEIVHVNA